MNGNSRKRVLNSIVCSVLVVVASGAAWAASSASQCGFKHVFTQPDEGGKTTVKVYEAKGLTLPNGRHPYVFITSLKVNTDGTLISYNENDPTGNRCESNPNAKPCAINNIRNAYRNHTRPVSDFIAVRNGGYPKTATWNVLSSDIIEKDAKSGKPCITANGYLVSMTADVAVAGGFGRVGDCDPSKWIDALTMPAVVLPRGATEFDSNGLKKRSVMVAVSAGASHRIVPGIVGDLGPPKELGEANIAMNRELNGLPSTDQPMHRKDAVKRFQAGRSAILLFPGTEFVLGRPISNVRIANAGADALAKFGGEARLVSCIQGEIDPAF